jgi:proline iminopeptidase
MLSLPRRTTSWSALVLSALLPLACASSTPAPKTGPRATRPREGLWPIRDTKLFVRDVGPRDAPLILVLHGGPGGNHRAMRKLEPLSKRYRLVLYDQRGSGRSARFEVSPARPTSFAKLTLDQHVEDIEALRRKLGREQLTLLGHSWGGALAVFYAARYPQRVAKLIVYSGGPETAALSKRKRAAHQAKLNEAERAAFAKGRGALIAAVKSGAPQKTLDELFVATSKPLFAALNCRRPAGGAPEEVGRGGFWINQITGRYVRSFRYEALRAGLARLRAPSLLIWGNCEPSPRERLTNLLPLISDASFVTFDRSGHNAIEEQPKLFFETLRSFLAGRSLPLKAYRKQSELPPLK